jgi:hypothetical protein
MRRTAKRIGHKFALLAVGIGDAGKRYPRQTGQNARMVAAHDAGADHTDS